jgi:hypothetical protein
MTRSINLPKPAVAALIAAEVVSVVLAWRDLGRRTDAQVRGRKAGWRIFITLNPGNSLAYWAFGRR